MYERIKKLSPGTPSAIKIPVNEILIGSFIRSGPDMTIFGHIDDGLGLPNWESEEADQALARQAFDFMMHF